MFVFIHKGEVHEWSVAQASAIGAFLMDINNFSKSKPILRNMEFFKSVVFFACVYICNITYFLERITKTSAGVAYTDLV